MIEYTSRLKARKDTVQHSRSHIVLPNFATAATVLSRWGYHKSTRVKIQPLEPEIKKDSSIRPCRKPAVKGKTASPKACDPSRTIISNVQSCRRQLTKVQTLRRCKRERNIESYVQCVLSSAAWVGVFDIGNGRRTSRSHSTYGSGCAVESKDRDNGRREDEGRTPKSRNAVKTYVGGGKGKENGPVW